MHRRSIQQLPLLLGIVISGLVLGCSNSESVEETEDTDFAKLDYLPLDDSEYPYAGIPRVVIVTENYQKIKNREIEIPAKLQIWGEKAPESEIMDLTIRGRGNTSWTEMPKKSYKIEFVNKQAMLGMPKDRDWALIANYADKTLMKNYLMYHLSAELGAYYAPRCEFIELYLNKDYLGVYLLTETIKISKNRINIPENENSYVVEFDARYEENKQAVFSHILREDSLKYNWRFHFEIHSPKNASQQTLKNIEDYIQTFETNLTSIHNGKDNHVAQWLDIDEYVKHYWVQEFSKNPDADFKTSVYFSWIKDDVIKMGPVWDFDLSCGNHDWEQYNSPLNWHTKNVYWNKLLFKDSIMTYSVTNYWIANEKFFTNTLNIIDSLQNILQKSAINNYKRWDILHSTAYKYHRKSYQTYKEATDDLKFWISERILWIDAELDKEHAMN